MATNDNTPARTIDSTGPQLRADRLGYVLAGERIDGFADRSDLDQQERRLLAKWRRAFAPDASSPAEEEFDGGESRLDSLTSSLRDAALRNAEEDVPRAIDVGLYDQLSPDEIRVVREPWLRLAGSPRREYPINVAELAAVIKGTPKQVRNWAECGLLPAYWIDGQRHFFSAAAIHGLALNRLDRNEIRAICRVLSADPDDSVPELVAAAAAGSESRTRPARLAHLLGQGDEVPQRHFSDGGFIKVGDFYATEIALTRISEMQPSDRPSVNSSINLITQAGAPLEDGSSAVILQGQKEGTLSVTDESGLVKITTLGDVAKQWR